MGCLDAYRRTSAQGGIRLPGHPDQLIPLDNDPVGRMPDIGASACGPEGGFSDRRVSVHGLEVEHHDVDQVGEDQRTCSQPSEPTASPTKCEYQHRESGC